MVKYATYVALADVEPLKQFACYAELPDVRNRAGKVVAPCDVLRLLRLCADAPVRPSPVMTSVIEDLDPFTTDALVSVLVDEWLRRAQMGEHWVLLAARHLPQTTATEPLARLLPNWRRRLDSTAARYVVDVVAATRSPKVLEHLLCVASDSTIGTKVCHALVHADPTVLAQVLAPAWLHRGDGAQDVIHGLGYPLMAAPWRFDVGWFRWRTRVCEQFASFAGALLWWARGRPVQLDEDQDLVDANDDVVCPRDHERIALLQPWKLSTSAWRLWQARLADYEIVQPFDQLSPALIDCG